MRRRAGLAAASVLIAALGPGERAAAAEGGPELARAVVEVVPEADGHRAAVREDITLTGVPLRGQGAWAARRLRRGCASPIRWSRPEARAPRSR
ncbi:MAG: hypothetical protein GEV11_18025 [Streptosporangiales bacterium]|nr:hypothetical protein [Streptosporangiales bacterium]